MAGDKKNRFKNIGDLKTDLITSPKVSNEIKLNLIKPNPFQPRFEMDVTEIKASIKKDGQLQSILLMVHESQYYIVAGHTRYQSCIELETGTIRADVDKNITMADMQRLALLENIQRVDLQPLEIALAVKELLDSGEYVSQLEVAQALSKSETYVSKLLKILTLEGEIIKHLKENRLSVGLEVLNELQGIKDPRCQVEWFHNYLADKVKVKDIREFKQSLKKSPAVPLFENKSDDKKYAFNCHWKNWPLSKKDEFKAEMLELLKKYK